MVVGAWKSLYKFPQYNNAKGFVYISTTDSVKKIHKVGKKIGDTYSNIPRIDDNVDYISLDSGQIHRYEFDLSTFMNLIRCQKNHGFFNCELKTKK